MEDLAEKMYQLGLEIKKSIENDVPGFSGGWVSSVAVSRLIGRRNKIRVPPMYRRAVLKALGYDYHPGLKEGRVDNRVNAPDYGKPFLFIRRGHPHECLTGSNTIGQAYADAQGIESYP
ncbi:MAG: hypothetical protein JO253_08150 [Alphaproteobacteria bacterium]|nr:hypothetical protein [Alphaproteobacteria bacterium]